MDIQIKENESVNRYLTELYPFLIPRDIFTGEPEKDYDYSYTWLDQVPDGWKIIFLNVLPQIKESLINANLLNSFGITQIKEKYGMLRIYVYNSTPDIDIILRDLEKTSMKTCIVCGRNATCITMGWISPFCESCSPINKKTIPIDEWFSCWFEEGK